MKTRILYLISLLVLSLSASAQQTTPTPPAEDKDTIKISTSLIQLDVTVTDKKGNVVTDLKPEDFEIYENGKKQNISNFSFISIAKPTETEAPKNVKPDKNSIPLPPVKLKPEQVRRTYALVVDDLGLNFENIFWVKESLKKFVKEQMQEGDLVAVIGTGIGIGSLQAFTSDKRQLLAAIEKIRWNPNGRAGINNFDPIRTTLSEDRTGTLKMDGSVRTIQGTQAEKEFQNQVNDFRNENFSVGTLGALNYIIRGMRDLPGRKAVMLFSEGFVFTTGNQPSRVLNGLRVLADLANRSSVVLYTLDPRGLQVPGMANSEDEIRNVLPESFDPATYSDARTDREDKFRDSQQSLRYLAYETGGVPYVNQNDLNKGIQRAIDDQSGYYLLGYQPDEETFDPKKNKFNRLEVKILRPDLKIRYRSGFFGITDEKLRQTNETPRQKLASALVSPFSLSEISLNIYSVFYNDTKNRSFVRSFVYIDPKNLTFTNQPDGTYQTKFDLIAMIFDAEGRSATNNINTQTLKFTKEQYATVQKKGMVYDLPIPIIKNGAYQFRIALQDNTTGKIGAVSQFIEVPNLEKKKLTLSNLIVKRYTAEEWKKISLGQPVPSTGSALLDTVLRKFERGETFIYSLVAYNAKAAAGQKPQMQSQVRLFREGKLILEGSPSAIDVSGQTDPQRIEISNAVTLGMNLEPGEYALQVVISDSLAKEKNQVAAQTIDFEIVR